jgi:hypothetical protein
MILLEAQTQTLISTKLILSQILETSVTLEDQLLQVASSAKSVMEK